MKKITSQTLKQLYEPIPDSLASRVHDTIRTQGGNEERIKPMKRKYGFSIALVALFLLAAMTALAASQFNLFRLRSGSIKPLEGADKLVVTDLGATDDEYIRFSVEEAVYDGQGAIVVFKLTPKDPDNYVLLNTAYQDFPRDLYDVVTGIPVPVPEGVKPEIVLSDGTVITRPTYEQDGVLYYADTTGTRITRKDGKQILEYGISSRMLGWEEDEPLFLDSWDCEEQPDGSVLVIAEGFSDEPIASPVTFGAHCGYFIGDDLTQSHRSKELVFTLEPAGTMLHARLIPQESSVTACQILSGELCFSKISGYISLVYTEADEAIAPNGTDWRVYDENGALLAGTAGRFIELDSLGDNVMMLIGDLQPLDKLPTSVTLECKVIGEDRTLGTVKCTLEQK